jgi:hypothetical protein
LATKGKIIIHYSRFDPQFFSIQDLTPNFFSQSLVFVRVRVENFERSSFHFMLSLSLFLPTPKLYLAMEPQANQVLLN